MKRFVLFLLAVSLVVAGVVSYFASEHPDGLERVAEDSGFAEKARDPAITVLPDYTVPGIHGFFSNALAGIIGVLASLGLVILVGKMVTRRNK